MILDDASLRYRALFSARRDLFVAQVVAVGGYSG
jgi:hypothetical protein